MSELNYAYAVFDGKCNFAVTNRLWQWNYGQKLSISGIELPSTFEVQFANKSGTETVSQIYSDGAVEIPDQFLTTGEWIEAFVFLHNEQDDGETVYKISIPVTARPEPSENQPTPVQQDVITETIAALNAAVESVPTAIDTALAEAKASGEFDGPPGERGTQIWYTTDKILTTSGDYYTTRRRNLVGKDDYATAAVGDYVFGPAPGEQGDPSALYTILESASVCKLTYICSIVGPQGEQGPAGSDGQPGQDGYSPTVTVTEITGGHRVTITDVNGDHTFDVMDGTGGGSAVSPTVTITTITGGHRVTITDVDHPSGQSFDVMDGVDGTNGTNGTNGTDGKDGSSFWTSSSAPDSPNYTFTIADLTGPTGATPAVGDIVFYSYYRYTITSVDTTTVLTGNRQSIRGAQGAAGANGTNGTDGTDGTDGTTFTPAVSSAGVISWTNDGGKSNPSSVDLVAAVLAALPTWNGGSY